MRYLELFSGIGGFRKAAELLNQDFNIQFSCAGYSEIDTHALNTYHANFRRNGELYMHDILRFTEEAENIRKLPDIDLLLGGFPCQAFSLIGKQMGFRDERGSVLFSIREILRMKKPSFIVMENVRHIERHNKGETLNHILNFFKSHGYEFIKTVILDTQHFGLAQRRSRIFIICSRKKLEIEIDQERIIEDFNNINNHSLVKFANVREILEKKTDKKYYLSERIKYTILANGSGNFKSKSQIDLDLARTLTATMVKMHRACQDNYYSDDFIQRGISHKDTPKEILYKIPIRKLTPLEALTMQGFDKAFYENAVNAGVSNPQLYKQAGNALSVNTGYALLHYLFVTHKIQDK